MGSFSKLLVTAATVQLMRTAAQEHRNLQRKVAKAVTAGAFLAVAFCLLLATMAFALVGFCVLLAPYVGDAGALFISAALALALAGAMLLAARQTAR